MDILAALFAGLNAILPFTDPGQQSFLLLLLGVLLGFVVGLLPGLGGPTAIALLLPFSYALEPAAALAFLLGLSAVTATTGDVTSVLLGIPGEGICAATVVDGYPLTKQGQAGRALGAALFSSLLGAVIGAFALALAIPIVKPLVLALASPERFMLVLLAMTFVAALSGDHLLKGLTMAALGLLLSTVGLDPIAAVPRFTFEPILGNAASLFLWDGVSLVAVTLGLFALPEIIELGGIKSRPAAVTLADGVRIGIKETLQHWRLVLRCSAIGAYVGLLPGIGGGPAQWLAYAHAVQSSADKSRFGHGAIEGVIGPGAANNAKEGGSLIPTLAFGVPGSVSSAILLAAFTLHGLVPGPDMLDPAKHLDLTFSLVWIIIIANIIAVALAFLFVRQLCRVTEVNGLLLLPVLLVFVYIGGFAVSNSSGDVVITLVFGLLGYYLVQHGWQRPPLLLGLVLGGLAENNFFITLQAYGSSWLARPGVVLLAALLVLIIVRAVRKKHRPAIPGGIPATLSTGAREYGFCLVLAGIFGYAVYQSLFIIAPEAPASALFPGLAAGLGLFFIASVCWRNRALMPAATAQSGQWRLLLCLGGYIAGIELFGFYLLTLCAMLVYLRLQAEQSWRYSIVFTLSLLALVYILFSTWLIIPLPEGELVISLTAA